METRTALPTAPQSGPVTHAPDYRDYFTSINTIGQLGLTQEQLNRCRLFEITGHANDPVLPKGTLVVGVEQPACHWSRLSGDCVLCLREAANRPDVGCVRRVSNYAFRVRYRNRTVADRQFKRSDVVAVYKIVWITLNRE